MTATLPGSLDHMQHRGPSRPRRLSLSHASDAHGDAPAHLEHNVAAKLNVRAHAARAAGLLTATVAVDLGTSQLLRIAAQLVRHCRSACVVASPLEYIFPAGPVAGARFAVALVLGLLVTGSYGSTDRRRDPRRILAACALATILPLWSALWDDPARVMLQFALGATLLALALIAARIALDAVMCRHAPGPLARTLLVGRAVDCEEVWNAERIGVRQGFTLVSTIASDGPTRLSVGSVRERLAEVRADTVLLCGQLDDATFASVVRAAISAECRVVATARRLDMPGVSPSVVWRRGQPLVEMRGVGLRWQQLLFKRMLDLVLATTLLIVLSPLLVLIALAVVLTSAGPVVYAQRRPGHHGRDFRCLKFRSMHHDAEAQLERDPTLHTEFVRNGFKLPGGTDPRITPVGRFLRRTSLDELPQLWNVLRGEMSVVGPRPILPDEISHYDEDCNLLLLLKPGITGLWQVSGRSGIGYRERIALQLEYVERWTLGRDIGILMRTVPAVLAQRGAQ